MRVLFLGAGAIGTYIGGNLAASGHEVAFIEQPAPAEAIARTGLVLHDNAGRQRVVRDIALHTDAAAALDAGPWDVLVCAVKSFDTASAIDGLVATGRPLPTVLSLQNGVDNEPLIAEKLGGPDAVVAGTVASAISKPGVGEVVEEKRRGLGVALGHRLSQPLVNALDGAGLIARGYPDAGSMKWSKLLTNLQGNAASAILDMPTGALFADRHLYALEIAALREALAVMDALGHHPVDLPGTPVRALALAARRLPRVIVQPILTHMLGDSRGHKMPSFHIDLHAGRGRTEVEFINGAVVRHGARVGVPTPVNRVLTETLEGLSRGDLDIEDYRHNPKALLTRLA